MVGMASKPQDPNISLLVMIARIALALSDGVFVPGSHGYHCHCDRDPRSKSIFMRVTYTGTGTNANTNSDIDMDIETSSQSYRYLGMHGVNDR